ncbi:MAG: hypothetical protein DRG24_07530, partial [Epsilonproteobacteria bacterium]
MKYLGIFGGLLLALLAGVYILVFTSPGNGIVAPLVEKKINEVLELSSKLDKFELRSDSFAITLQLDDFNTIEAVGNFSLFAQTLDTTYRIRLDKLESLKKLTQKPLYGKLHTDGTVTGSLKSLTIDGKSDVAESATTYNILLTDFNPERVIANIKGAKLEQLLHLAGEPTFASADLDVDIKLKNLDPENLQGDADIKLSKGLFNSKILKETYAVNLPRTRFNFLLDAQLNGKNITYNTVFDSSLAKIDSQGTIIPKTVGMDLDYRIAFEKLELLKPLTNAPLQGPLTLSGTLKGDKEKLLVNGQTDIAKSKTIFTATLEAFKPRSVQAQMKHLKLAPLFKMLSQPHYADGSVDLTIDIPDARVGHLNGTVATALTKGRLDGKQIGKDMNLTGVPNAPFSVNTLTTLSKHIIDTDMIIDSSLVTLKSRHAKMDLENNIITADYHVNVPNLSKLFFITERPLKGKIALFGDLRKDDHLLFTAHSDTLGGSLDAKLLDDDFHADLKNIQTLDALEMLTYPEMFKSSLNGTLDYNLVSKKGLLDSTLSDGLFTQNVMMDLYKQYGKQDLYKEQFNGTLKSRILDSKTDT